MNVEFEDEEITAVDVESRVSEPNKLSKDPPSEFTGTKPIEFKSHRKKVKLWLLFTRTLAQLQGASCFDLSRLTGQLGMPATDWKQRMWPLTMELEITLTVTGLILWRGQLELDNRYCPVAFRCPS